MWGRGRERCGYAHDLVEHEALAVKEDADPFRIAMDHRIVDLYIGEFTILVEGMKQGLNTHTLISFIKRILLRSRNSRPTVKLWKLWLASYFFTVSRKRSMSAEPTLHARFRARSSSCEDVALFRQKGCIGEVSTSGDSVGSSVPRSLS